jgi:hypothetical protein
MDISITSPADIGNDRFQDSAKSQLIRAFESFSGNIVHIDVALTNEEEPKGEINRHCRIFVQMSGFESVSSEATDENPLAAVIRAAKRARQTMIASLNRPRSHQV